MNDERGYPARLADGGAARAVGYEVQAEVLHIVAERPFPPGRPLVFTLVLSETKVVLQGKAIGSKRREDGHYEVKIKLHTLLRDHRARLAVLPWD